MTALKHGLSRDRHHHVGRENGINSTQVDDGTFIQSRVACAPAHVRRTSGNHAPSLRSAFGVPHAPMLRSAPAGHGYALRDGFYAVRKPFLLQGFADRVNAGPANSEPRRRA